MEEVSIVSKINRSNLKSPNIPAHKNYIQCLEVVRSIPARKVQKSNGECKNMCTQQASLTDPNSKW